MKRSILIGVAFLLSTNALADEPRKAIPLDQIWGYNMPPTRDVAGIPLSERPTTLSFAEQDKMRRNAIEVIYKQIASKLPTERAWSGFVMPRPADSIALVEASTQLKAVMRASLQAKKFPFGQNLPADVEYTLFFFSHPSSYYCRLRHIELIVDPQKRKDSQIVVQYQFQPHHRAEATLHFAVIPLGKLAAGKYHVQFEQLPMEQEYLDEGFEPVNEEGAVCNIFSFEVGGETKQNTGR